MEAALRPDHIFQSLLSFNPLQGLKTEFDLAWKPQNIALSIESTRKNVCQCRKEVATLMADNRNKHAEMVDQISKTDPETRPEMIDQFKLLMDEFSQRGVRLENKRLSKHLGGDQDNDPQLVQAYNHLVEEQNLLITEFDQLLESTFNQIRELRDILRAMEASRECAEERKNNPAKPMPADEFLKEMEAMI